ncbi:MAG: DinB family protein [Chloroflexota bacterium]
MDPIVEILLERSRWLYQVLRDEVRGLTPEQLDFVPAPEANSVAALVVHTLGSQAGYWSLVAHAPLDRDRAAEFATKGMSAEELIARIDAADRALADLAAKIDHATLMAEHERAGQSRVGAYWLINSFGHAREHLGHLQLTKQLLPEHYPPPARPA